MMHRGVTTEPLAAIEWVLPKRKNGKFAASKEHLSGPKVTSFSDPRTMNDGMNMNNLWVAPACGSMLYEESPCTSNEE